MAELQGALEDYLYRDATADAFKPGLRSFTAFQPIITGGESLVTVHFPYTFVDRPVFSFGFELDPNRPLVPTKFPLPGATVVQWITRMKPSDQAAGTFVGAKVAVVVEGSEKYSGTFHLTFSGQSMAYPSANVGSMTVGGAI